MNDQVVPKSPDIDLYVQRLKALAADAPPLQVLQTTAAKIETLIEGFDKARLNARPSIGKWSVTEIVAHLCDSETVTSFRLRQILALPDGCTIAAYDQDAWANVSRNSEVPIDDAISLFSALRKRNLRLWKSLTRVQLETFGQHKERGRESLQDLLVLVPGHDVNHLNQIRNIVDAVALEKPATWASLILSFTVPTERILKLVRDTS